jgi:Protein of unknown function (DUF3551)
MIDVLRASIIAGAAILVVAPASAQRYDANYPVCLQKWEWGGSSTIYCRYNSWEECKATASGLSAMCMDNPYWSQPRPPSARTRGPAWTRP